jgi:hypothetical protein
MILLASPRLVSLAPRLRQTILVLAALFVAHDAVYVARFGIGAGYARAMTAQGHDGYWAPASFLLVIGLAVVALVGLAAYRGLTSDAKGIGRAADADGRPSYVAELATIWLRLFPTVAILFAIQENLEHLAVDGHLAGIAPLVGPGSAAVLPVLAATTFALAAVGAVVRWRIRVLVARIAAAVAGQRYLRLTATARPSAWGIVAATIAHRWIIGRRDAGRAPPGRLHAIAILTA